MGTELTGHIIEERTASQRDTFVPLAAVEIGGMSSSERKAMREKLGAGGGQVQVRSGMSVSS